MKNPVFKLMACLLAFVAMPTWAQKPAADLACSPTSGDFAFVTAEGAAIIIYSQNEEDVVGIAANALAADAQLVTSIKPAVAQEWSDASAVVIGTLGTSTIIDELAASGAIETEKVKGQWETFGLKVTTYKGQKVLAIYGSDPRGTAFGVFELSRTMGVSPWYWWADVEPEHQDAIFVSTSGTVFGPPSVKYRGIFINDEDWGMQPWAAKKMDTDIKDIGQKTYEKIFELLLRLKANYLWPAMHPCTKAFWYYTQNPVVARRYSIVLGSSHCEPMLRNNVDEWQNNYQQEYGKAPGDWNWATNRTAIKTYWADRIKASKDNPAVYTVGMRGIHDGAMPGYSNNEDKRNALKQVIAEQRKLLETNLGRPANEVPQLFCPYKEALTLYRMGLDLPDDITLLWSDDNHGYMRQLSDDNEQKRSGGGGVYYHLSYWGSPCDYLWLCSTSPALISNEMHKAYDMNCKNIWVFNVGDLKPAELETQYSLDLAWDVDTHQPETASRYPYYWAQEIFGSDVAEDIATIKQTYYRLAASGKPEHMHLISLSSADKQQRLDDYRAMMALVEEVKGRIPERLQDAYFQLIYYPCRAALLMNEKVICAAQSYEAARAGDATLTARLGETATTAYKEIVAMTKEYNTSLAGGKWDGMMDYAPRGLNQFNAPSVASANSVSNVAIPGEDDLVIKHYSAADYIAKDDKGYNIITINGLGVSGASVTVRPLNMTAYTASNVTSAPSVDYRVHVAKGKNIIRVKCLPSFALNASLKLDFGMSVDGGKPKLYDITLATDAAPWTNNVINGYSEGNVTFEADEAKDITVRIFFTSPSVVVSEIEVTCNPATMLTSVLVNPGFEQKSVTEASGGAVVRGDPYGWTRTGEIIGNSFGMSSDATGYEGKSICWYNSSPMPGFFQLSQTVKGLEPGLYVVRCKLGVFSDRVGNQRLFANNNATYYGPEGDYDKNIVEGENYSFMGNAYGQAGGSKGQLREMAVLVTLAEGEDLTLGIRSSNLLKDGTRATNNTGWFKVDDFRLQYLGRETYIKTTEAAMRETTVNVATPAGLLLRQNVKPSEALRGLTPGLYIVGGKKIVK